MKTRFVILVLLLGLFVGSASSRSVNLQERKHFQQGSMRMPSITCVSADYENGLITVDVKGYNGGIQVLVSDSQGNIVSSTMSSITNSGVVSLDLGALAEGDYTLYIVLGNTTYSGEFTL